MSLKIILASLFLIGCIGTSALAQEKIDSVNYYYNNKEISLTELVKLADDYDVIFFDEYHDQTVIHQAEEAFFKEMYKQNSNMILSLEMFERDVQSVMDDYLSGKIDEDNFKANSRPWPNYQEDYRPLIEFAKSNDIYVLAGNVPRRMAAQYAKAGDFSLISDSDKIYLPEKHLVEYSDYYNKFKTYMSSGGENQPMMMTPERIELFYKAQCLKDDVMAESIDKYIKANKSNREIKVLHMQGSFHGEGHLGVVEKLHKLNPKLKLLVINPVESKDYAKVKANFGKDDVILTFTKK